MTRYAQSASAATAAHAAPMAIQAAAEKVMLPGILEPASQFAPESLHFSVVKQVLVLNASYEPLNVTSVRRAHVLVFKGKAEVLEELYQPLRSASDTYAWPHVIRLVNYVRVPRAVKRKISRRALFARDGWQCLYCGSRAGRLTLDHVVPRSRGGDSVWENVVTSCAPCNLRKGNRLLEEARMTLLRQPRPPQPVLFIRLASPKIP